MLKFLTKNRPKIKRNKGDSPQSSSANAVEQATNEPQSPSHSSDQRDTDAVPQPHSDQEQTGAPLHNNVGSSSTESISVKEQEHQSIPSSSQSSDPRSPVAVNPVEDKPRSALEKAQELYQKSLQEAKQRDLEAGEGHQSATSDIITTTSQEGSHSEEDGLIRPKKIVPNDAMAALASMMRASAGRRTLLVQKQGGDGQETMTNNTHEITDSTEANKPQESSTSSTPPISSSIQPAVPVQPRIPIPSPASGSQSALNDVSSQAEKANLPPITPPKPPSRRDLTMQSSSRPQSMVDVTNDKSSANQPLVPPRPKSLAVADSSSTDLPIDQTGINPASPIHKIVASVTQLGQVRDSDESIVAPHRDRGPSVVTLTQVQQQQPIDHDTITSIPPLDKYNEHIELQGEETLPAEIPSIVTEDQQLNQSVTSRHNDYLNASFPTSEVSSTSKKASKIVGSLDHPALSLMANAIKGSISSTQAIRSCDLDHIEASAEHVVDASIASSDSVREEKRNSRGPPPPLPRPRSVVFQDQSIEVSGESNTSHGPAPPPPILEPSPASSTHGSLSDGLHTEGRGSTASIKPRSRLPSTPSRPKSMVDKRQQQSDGSLGPSLPARPKSLATDSELVKRDSIVSFSDQVETIPSSNQKELQEHVMVEEKKTVSDEKISSSASGPAPSVPIERKPVTRESDSSITASSDKGKQADQNETLNNTTNPSNSCAADDEFEIIEKPTVAETLHEPQIKDPQHQESSQVHLDESVSDHPPVKRIPGVATNNAALGALAAAMKSGLGRVQRQASYGTDSINGGRDSRSSSPGREGGRPPSAVSSDSISATRDRSISPVKSTTSPTKSPSRFQGFNSPTGPSLQFKKKDNSLSGDDKALEKAAIQWLNHHLTSKGIQIDDLTSNLVDGLNLIYALEAQTGEAVGKYNKRAMMPIHKLDNIAVALKFLSKKGVNTTFLTPQDVLDGNKNKILTLFSHILRVFPL